MREQDCNAFFLAVTQHIESDDEFFITIANWIENDRRFGQHYQFFVKKELKIQIIRKEIEDTLERKDFRMFFGQKLLSEGNKTLRQIGYMEEGRIELEQIYDNR